jgi:hypothetical protein
VARVGHQRGRVGNEAVDEFDGDKQGIDADGQRKGFAMAGGQGVMVSVAVAMVVVAMVMAVIVC